MDVHTHIRFIFVAFYIILKQLLAQLHWAFTILIPMRDAYLYGACVSLFQSLDYGGRLPLRHYSQSFIR